MPTQTGGAMSTEIWTTSFSAYEVSPDGLWVRMNVVDQGGNPASFVFPVDRIGQLLMTLPAMAKEVMRKKHKDDSLRVVFPMQDWTLERSTGQNLIFTLRTEGGFEAAFGFSESQLDRLAEALTSRARSAPTLN
jgi:hypothetical protein